MIHPFGDPDTLIAKARSIPSMSGRDLAEGVSTKQRYVWDAPVLSLLPGRQTEAAANHSG